MSWVAILLVVLSSAIHAGWNLLSKSRKPTIVFFLLAGMAGTLALSPVLLLNWSVLRLIPMRVFAFAACAGACMALYYAALAGAYRAGDLSVAYPLARSSPILVVAIVVLVLGRGGQLSWMCVFGSALVVLGCFLVPMKRLSDFRLSNYFNATCGLALLAAVGTAGYSIFDDEALRLLRQTPEVTLAKHWATLLYACIEGACAVFWMGVATLLRRAPRRSLRADLRANVWHAALAGLAIYAAYSLVLVALAYARNLSYVVAFRQLSIPIGTGLGILVFREPAWPPKLFGVAILCGGLLLVAAG